MENDITQDFAIIRSFESGRVWGVAINMTDGIEHVVACELEPHGVSAADDLRTRRWENVDEGYRLVPYDESDAR